MPDPVVDPWSVIAYEVRMFRATYALVLDKTRLATLPKVLQNAVEESAVLHTRILCDVFLSRAGSTAPDDIQLGLLFPNWTTDQTYEGLTDAVRRLGQRYGDSLRTGSSCWTINKMMAHPTFHRGTSYDYTTILESLQPPLETVITELERLRRIEFTWTW